MEHSNMMIKREKFSPLKLSSPKSIQSKNLTGSLRVVSDLVVDIHANVQHWHNFHHQGLGYIKDITQEKCKRDPENLQDLCDKLEKICDNLDNIVLRLEQIKNQLNTIRVLERATDKLFISWSPNKFCETAEILWTAFRKEAELKRNILANVAHNHTDSWILFNLTAWGHQPFVSGYLNVLVESLLIETGHR
ncbi:cyclin-dependent kinase 2-interacting protein-like [Pseudomyrmex gracilis]|uniref:cyclin-dependent kinase 2-interacting protein-like n=1 Tax=Pseudomyrmex gracilis TaxID=219809 RepID=UPI000995D8B9|nr:cyclin-dependent kinase 2-interacting protein-like [Pseudomyrmex gracilis]